MQLHDVLYDTLGSPGVAPHMPRAEGPDTIYTTQPADGQDAVAAATGQATERDIATGLHTPVTADDLRLADQEVQRWLAADEAERIAKQEAERKTRAHKARLRFLQQEQEREHLTREQLRQRAEEIGEELPDQACSDVPTLECPPSSRTSTPHLAAHAAPSAAAPPSSPNLTARQPSTTVPDTRAPSIDPRAPSLYAPPSSPYPLHADAQTERGEEEGQRELELHHPPQRSLPPPPLEAPRLRSTVDSPPQRRVPEPRGETPQSRSEVSWFAQTPASKTRPSGTVSLGEFEESGVSEERNVSVHKVIERSRRAGRLGSPVEYASCEGAIADAEEGQQKWERERWNWKMVAADTGTGTPPAECSNGATVMDHEEASETNGPKTNLGLTTAQWAEMHLKSKGALPDKGRLGMNDPGSEIQRGSGSRMFSVLLPDPAKTSKRESNTTDPSREITPSATPRNSGRFGTRDSIRSEDDDDDSLPNSMSNSARGDPSETRISPRKQQLFVALESRLLRRSEEDLNVPEVPDENTPLSPNFATLQLGDEESFWRASHQQSDTSQEGGIGCVLAHASAQPLSLQSAHLMAGDVLGLAHALACYEQGPVRIANVARGGPAFREGLEVGDLLLEVNGIPVLERPLSDIMMIVRGKAGSTVELKIARGLEGGTQVVKKVIIVREPGRRVGRVKSPAFGRMQSPDIMSPGIAKGTTLHTVKEIQQGAFQPAGGRKKTSPRPPSYLPFAVVVKLDLPMTAAGEPGTPQRIIFEKDMRQDLSNASGLSSEHFCIRNISAGSIKVDTQILPDTSEGSPSSEHVAQILAGQVHDPRSLLRAGTLTKYVKSITFQGGVEHQPGHFDTQRIEKSVGARLLPETPAATPSPGSNGLSLPLPSAMVSMSAARKETYACKGNHFGTPKVLDTKTVLESKPTSPTFVNRAPFDIRLPNEEPEQSSDYVADALPGAQSLRSPHASTHTENLSSQRTRIPLENQSLGGGLPNVTSPAIPGNESSEPDMQFTTLPSSKDAVSSPDQASTSAAPCAVHVRVISAEHLPGANAHGDKLKDTYVSISAFDMKLVEFGSTLAKINHKSITVNDMRMAKRRDRPEDLNQSMEALWPQAQTRVAPGKIFKRAPVWEQNFILKTSYTTRTVRVLTDLNTMEGQPSELPVCAIAGQELVLLATVHNEDALKEDTCIGKVIYKDLKLGQKVEQVLPLHHADGSRVYDADGNIATLNLSVQYVKREQLNHNVSDHIQYSLGSPHIQRPASPSKQLDAPAQCAVHSAWIARDMKRSEEMKKSFDESAHLFTAGEQTGSNIREQAKELVGAVRTARMEITENATKPTMESMVLERMLRQVKARRQGSGGAYDHFIAFSPFALCSMATLFCNACARETLLEVWQDFQKMCSVRSLAALNEEHLARSHKIGSVRYGMRPQVHIETSIWIPRDGRVQKNFVELAQHFYAAEIFRRQGDGYDDMLDWIQTKSAMGKEVKKSDINSELMVERKVKQEEWVAAVSVFDVSAPWSRRIREVRTSVFTKENGISVPAKTLCFAGRFPCVRTNEFTCSVLPCGVCDELQLLVVLPRRAVNDAITDMISTSLITNIADAVCEEMVVEVPTFEVDRLCDVMNNMKQLQALRNLVSQSMEFEGLGSGCLRLNGILQRHYLRVDECGINTDTPSASIDIDLTQTRPYTVMRVGRIQDANGTVQGGAGYINRDILPGDVLVSIDGVLLDTLPGKTTAHSYLQGSTDSIIDIVLARKQDQGRETQLRVKLRRDCRNISLNTGRWNEEFDHLVPTVCLNRPFFAVLRDVGSGAVLSVNLVDAPSEHAEPPSTLVEAKAWNPKKHYGQKTQLDVLYEDSHRSPKYADTPRSPRYENAVQRHGLSNSITSANNMSSVPRPSPKDASEYGPTDPYWYLEQMSQMADASIRTRSTGNFQLDSSIVTECFGDLEGRPGGISRHEMGLFYSKFVDSFPEANSELKRKALAYLQTFVGDAETASTFSNEPFSLGGKSTKWNVAVGESNSYPNLPGFKNGVEGGHLVGPQMVYDSASTMNSSYFMSFDAINGVAGPHSESKIQPNGDPPPNAPDTATRKSLRLWPAPPKCVVGLEVTSGVPRQIAQVTDLIDMYYVRQGEQGYSNAMVCPGDRLIAVNGADAEMLATSDLVKLFDGPYHSVINIRLARLESGEHYEILVLRHLPGEFDPYPERDEFVQAFDDHPKDGQVQFARLAGSTPAVVDGTQGPEFLGTNWHLPSQDTSQAHTHRGGDTSAHEDAGYAPGLSQPPLAFDSEQPKYGSRAYRW